MNNIYKNPAEIDELWTFKFSLLVSFSTYKYDLSTLAADL